MNERIESLPHERILECYYDPRHHRGELEILLAAMRAGEPGRERNDGSH